ncbi:hypothetical protein GGH98_005979, partial [Coemansia sp. RSA 454]
ANQQSPNPSPSSRALCLSKIASNKLDPCRALRLSVKEWQPTAHIIHVELTCRQRRGQLGASSSGSELRTHGARSTRCSRPHSNCRSWLQALCARVADRAAPNSSCQRRQSGVGCCGSCRCCSSTCRRKQGARTRGWWPTILCK